jgi:hypothetical protein
MEDFSFNHANPRAFTSIWPNAEHASLPPMSRMI